ncbi:MAG: Rrf2 family transcriptional regulator [Lachnospiraceae bacterium]|nr:Rrf2 family transcriptional regulator [Lachnospiraceae bacterium]
MDTKFAVAIHSMIFISESEEAMTSETLAETLNTNPSYVRRILASLVKEGMISSASKTKGCTLLKAPEEIYLNEIYDAVKPGVSKLNMDLSQNLDTEIYLGKCEQPVIEGLFNEMENAVEKILAEKTLHDLISNVRQNMKESDQ